MESPPEAKTSIFPLLYPKQVISVVKIESILTSSGSAITKLVSNVQLFESDITNE